MFVVRPLGRSEGFRKFDRLSPQAKACTTNSDGNMLAANLESCLTAHVAYLWRKLTPKERATLLAWRNQRSFPWHTPPHAIGGHGAYHVTAACLNHAPHIGHSPARMESFSI